MATGCNDLQHRNHSNAKKQAKAETFADHDLRDQKKKIPDQ